MELLVDAFEPTHIHVGVDLRGGDVGVAEQLLHHAEVGAAFDEVGCEAVP
jgi:hypothetical protein